MKRFCFGSLFIFLFFNALAQNDGLRFKQITHKEGLPTERDNDALVQDEKGFIWIASDIGLIRFDGNDFKTYRNDPNNSHSLSPGFVNKLLFDDHHNLWIGTASGMDLYRPGKDSFDHIPFKHPRHKDDFSEAIIDISQDEDGMIFALSYFNLYILDEKNGCMVPFVPENDKGKVFEGSFKSLLVNKDFVFLGTNTQGLFVYNRSIKKLEHYTADLHNFKTNKIQSFLKNKNGQIWIGTNSGLYIFETFNNPKSPDRITEVKELESYPINAIVQDQSGNIWIAAQEAGLFKFDSRIGKFINYRHSDDDDHSLLNNKISNLYIDREQNIWALTNPHGISLASLNKPQGFKPYTCSASGGNCLSYNMVSAFAEDPLGNLWIGTDGGGLDYFYRQTGTFKHYPIGTNSNSILSLYLDSANELWIGSFEGGLCRFNPKTHAIKVYKYNPSDTTSLSSNDVWAITEDINREIVALTLSNGINILNPEKKHFRRLYGNINNPKALSQNGGTTLCPDEKGNIWVGTYHGLNLWNPQTEALVRYFNNKSDAFSISDNRIISIYKDSKNNIWIGTKNGLNLFDKASGKFQRFTINRSSWEDAVNSILEDNEGDLWLGTNNGLARIQGSTRKIENFDESYGLPGRVMLKGACYKNREGELFFGGIGGFVRFYPKDIRRLGKKPTVYITDLKIFDKSIRTGDTLNDRVILSGNILETTQITLTHLENSFSIGFASIDCMNPGIVNYAYKMEGFDQKWRNNRSNRIATYTNLDPGTYTFMVKASAGLNESTSRLVEMKVIILPPPWKTWWAYTMYAVVFVSLIVIYLKIMHSRMILQRNLFMERVIHEKNQEANRMKVNFFTNITHEFRTPLTLILGPVENLLERFQTDKSVFPQLHLIKQNAGRLLSLINELLDLRKLEDSSIELNTSQYNIIEFVSPILSMFKDHARIHQIDLKLEYEQNPIMVWFDHNKMEKVIYNLLSNAFKFTPDGEDITCRIKMSAKDNESFHHVEIAIEDNGIGIEEENIPKIFDRYYSSKSSRENKNTGIGLALSKEIVEQHKGTIEVKNNNEKGVCFTILLPLGTGHLKESQISKAPDIDGPHLLASEFAPKNLDPATGADQKIILVVEDNREVRDFIREEIEKDYKVLEAQDGNIGLEMALQHVPDLIISDIMMPGIDGRELCYTLKSDDRTSHIPVILLTALAHIDNKVEGIELGADSYISKPFYPKHLRARIKQLIALRDSLQKKYTQQIQPELKKLDYQPKKITKTSVDELFLQRAIEIVEKNLSNSNFRIEDMSEDLGMNYLQLYRKIKALTNLSLKQFVMTLRMKNAVNLLMSGKFTISEIGYDVGFSSPAYFTECFKKHFGISPSDYLKENNPVINNSPF